MASIRGRICNGQVVLTDPANLPDGTEVEVVPIDNFGAEDEDRPMSASEVARVLAAMDAIEPLEMTEQEIEAVEADRRARKAWEKAQFDEHADRLRSMWE